MITIEQARSAKDSLLKLLSTHPALSGVGISKDDTGSHVLKANFSSAPTGIPTEVDGVPVKVEIVGEVKALTNE